MLSFPFPSLRLCARDSFAHSFPQPPARVEIHSIAIRQTVCNILQEIRPETGEKTIAAVVSEARYILSDITCNSNKFWNIVLHDDNTCITQWGRVGEAGASKEFSYPTAQAAKQFFDLKRREKESKGYAPQKTLGSPNGVAASRLAEIAMQQIETDSPETVQLIGRLSRANVHNILSQTTLQYDASLGTFSTPLGIVTQDALIEARALLTNIGNHVHTGRYDVPEFVRALNQYLMLVPQSIGRAKPDPRLLYPDLAAVQAQNTLLDNLEASLQTVLTHPKTQETVPPSLFNAKIRTVEDGRIVDRIRRKYYDTLQQRHACAHLDVARVYSIEIADMAQAFEQTGWKIGNVQELWHGTRIGNLLSILKNGFVIPASNAPHVTGRMFGNGVYFSDQSTKSLNYAYGYWGTGNRDNNCFMFLCEVAMGRSYTPASYTEMLPKPKSDSTFAKAGASGVMNNEMIVYNTTQINPTYLIEFGPARQTVGH